MPPQGIGVPGQRDQHQPEPGTAMAQGAQQQGAITLRQHRQQKRGQRDQHRHRPLDQHAQAHPDGQALQGGAAPVFQVAPEVERREHQKETQHRVGRGRMGHGPAAQAAGVDERGQHSRLPAQARRHKSGHGQAGAPGGQGRRQAHRPFVHAKHRHRDGLQPVHANGFVKTVGAVQGGVAPVAGGQDFARGFRESAFVHIEQRRSAQTPQGQQPQQQRQAQPGRARYRASIARPCALSEAHARPRRPQAENGPACGRPAIDRRRSKCASATRPARRW